MKVIFDTNVYISWIREEKNRELLLNQYTQKFISSIVLMELWAGCKTKESSRIIEKLQNPYINAERICAPSLNDFIKTGQILSDLPAGYYNKIKNSSFINDIFIGLNTLAIGAVLYTENKSDFEIIKDYLKGLKIEYL